MTDPDEYVDPNDAARFFGYTLEEWLTPPMWMTSRVTADLRGTIYSAFVLGGGGCHPSGKLVSSWFWTRDEYPLDISMSAANDARKLRMLAADIYGVG
jgi:hypothetical protein